MRSKRLRAWSVGSHLGCVTLFSASLSPPPLFRPFPHPFLSRKLFNALEPGLVLHYAKEPRSDLDNQRNWNDALENFAAAGALDPTFILVEDFSWTVEGLVDGDPLPTLQLLITLVRYYGFGEILPSEVSYEVHDPVTGMTAPRPLTLMVCIQAGRDRVKGVFFFFFF